ncbi:hypothetical protein CEXT_68031 [Caerostris extrusa]|uniref:Uncharacterized protein n=1 Tax=Caerostris extrusa TaxID=172846 RepID=A0AAV4VSG7_CAEEX|nr:hypothetical protein CEXT_68031 [Caerostris extrusa]
MPRGSRGKDAWPQGSGTGLKFKTAKRFEKGDCFLFIRACSLSLEGLKAKWFACWLKSEFCWTKTNGARLVLCLSAIINFSSFAFVWEI